MTTGIESRVDLTLARLRETAAADVLQLERSYTVASAWHEAMQAREEAAFDRWSNSERLPLSRLRRLVTVRHRGAWMRACDQTDQAAREAHATEYQLGRARRRLQDLQSPYERDVRIERATRRQELRRAAIEGELLS